MNRLTLADGSLVVFAAVDSATRSPEYDSSRRVASSVGRIVVGSCLADDPEVDLTRRLGRVGQA